MERVGKGLCTIGALFSGGSVAAMGVAAGPPPATFTGEVLHAY
jgi:hypothetical protein